MITISFRCSSGSAMLNAFIASNKRSGSIILVHFLPGQGQLGSQSKGSSGDLLRIC